MYQNFKSVQHVLALQLKASDNFSNIREGHSDCSEKLLERKDLNLHKYIKCSFGSREDRGTKMNSFCTVSHFRSKTFY